MKSRHIFYSAIATTLIVTSGCKKEPEAETPVTPSDTTETAVQAKPEDPNQVVASVNGTQYLRKEMNAVVDALLKAQNVPEAQMAEARKYFEQRAAYSFIMKTLILGEAKKQNLSVTEEDRAAQIAKMTEALKAQNKTPEQYFKESPMGEEAARQEFEDGLVIDKLLQKQVLDTITVSDEEVKKSLEEIKQQNAELTEKNKGLVAENAKKKEQIVALKKQLDEGADFSELAKKNSDCPSKEKGGELGEFTKGQMVKPFEDAAFAQEIGKVGDIVETPLVTT